MVTPAASACSRRAGLRALVAVTGVGAGLGKACGGWFSLLLLAPNSGEAGVQHGGGVGGAVAEEVLLHHRDHICYDIDDSVARVSLQRVQHAVRPCAGLDGGAMRARGGRLHQLVHAQDGLPPGLLVSSGRALLHDSEAGVAPVQVLTGAASTTNTSAARPPCAGRARGPMPSMMARSSSL